MKTSDFYFDLPQKVQDDRKALVASAGAKCSYVNIF